MYNTVTEIIYWFCDLGYCINVFHLFPVAPTCRPNQPRVHGVAKQERARVRCSVEANPPQVTFRWTFNNSAESIEVAAAHVARARSEDP